MIFEVIHRISLGRPHSIPYFCGPSWFVSGAQSIWNTRTCPCPPGAPSRTRPVRSRVRECPALFRRKLVWCDGHVPPFSLHIAHRTRTPQGLRSTFVTFVTPCRADVIKKLPFLSCSRPFSLLAPHFPFTFNAIFGCVLSCAFLDGYFRQLMTGANMAQHSDWIPAEERKARFHKSAAGHVAYAQCWRFAFHFPTAISRGVRCGGVIKKGEQMQGSWAESICYAQTDGAALWS